MAKGAVHPNGTNFRRFPCRFDVVERLRRLIAQRIYDRPEWLDAAERAPPLELHSLQLQQRKVYNPYSKLVRTVLNKYPSLRFQDCYVDGNEWSKGNDRYRDDHPVMQFAAKQLQRMHQGMSRYNAFKQTEKEFYARRLELEKQQKLMMAIAVDENVQPIFTTGHAYWQSQIGEEEARHLQRIRNVLRALRRRKLVATQTATSPPLPRVFSPRNYKHRGALRRAAFESAEGDSDLLLLSSPSSPSKRHSAEEPFGIGTTAKTDWPSASDNQAATVSGVQISVPLQEAHLKKKAVTYDPLYAGRHGLFLDEAPLQHTHGGATETLQRPPFRRSDPGGSDELQEGEDDEGVPLQGSVNLGTLEGLEENDDDSAAARWWDDWRPDEFRQPRPNSEVAREPNEGVIPTQREELNRNVEDASDTKTSSPDSSNHRRKP